LRSFDIIGYTYEGANHCDDCAAERFGRCPCDLADVHGTDGEGNEVYPIFAGDEQDGSVFCDTCGTTIYEKEEA
jgi:hypothetical protein